MMTILKIMISKAAHLALSLIGAGLDVLKPGFSQLAPLYTRAVPFTVPKYIYHYKIR